MGIISTVARISARGTGISRLCGRRMLSSSSSKSVVCPWLMLQPKYDSRFNSNRARHVFYNIEESKAVGPLKMVGGDDAVSYPNFHANYVCSSHGWLAFYSKCSRTMFWSNPVSCGRIDRPVVGDTPNSGEDVSLVIISAPPDHASCRALMIYGPDRRLALGAPAHDGSWSPIDDDRRRCDSFTFSRRRNAFFCLMAVKDDDTGEYATLRSWDLSSAKIDWSLDSFLPNLRDSSYNKEECLNIKYLAFDDDGVFLYVVVRRALPRLLPSGSFNLRNFHHPEYRTRGYHIGYAHNTVGFDVYKVDIDGKSVSYMESSLDGLALFVGTNETFVVRPGPGSRLQPNSIYFTDLPEFTTIYHTDTTLGDNGVFNYENKCFSSIIGNHERMDLQSCTTRRFFSWPMPLWYVPTPTPI